MHSWNASSVDLREEERKSKLKTMNVITQREKISYLEAIGDRKEGLS